MAANNAEVSSEALTGLQTDLTQLSNSLHEIYDLMNADMSQVGEEWRDGKYEEFVNGYRPQINKCEEISVRYHDWCTRILSPAIERVVEVEQSNVGGDGSGVSMSGGSAAAGAGAAGSVGVATSGAKTGMASKFNTGKEASGRNITVQARSNAASQNTPSKGSAIDPKVAQEKKSSVGGDAAKQISDAADVLCSNPKVKKSKLSVEEVSDSGNWGLDGNVGGGAKMKGIFDVSAKMGGFFNSGKKTTKVKIEDAEIDCTQQ